jgi:hypothetical protein
VDSVAFPFTASGRLKAQGRASITFIRGSNAACERRHQFERISPFPPPDPLFVARVHAAYGSTFPFGLVSLVNSLLHPQSSDGPQQCWQGWLIPVVAHQGRTQASDTRGNLTRRLST